MCMPFLEKDDMDVMVGNVINNVIDFLGDSINIGRRKVDAIRLDS